MMIGVPEADIANIARQQGKRTVKEQKKEKTKIKRSRDSDCSAIRGIGEFGSRSIVNYIDFFLERNIKKVSTIEIN